MEILRHLLYLGSDDEFYDEIKDYCKNYIQKGFKIQMENYEPGTIVKAVVENDPNIIYLDFTSFSYREQIFEEILFLKKIRRFKSTLFVAILSNASNKRDQQHLYSSGFQLGYIKGGEIENLIADSFYVGLGIRVPMPRFAKARKIDKEMVVGVCSTLSKVSLEEFYIETDLELNLNELPMMLPMFDELEATSFKVRSYEETGLLYPMTNSFVLEYPYISPWDDINDKTIQKETVETWFELNSEGFLKKDCFVKIVSKNVDLFQPIYEEALALSFFIEVCEMVDFSSIKQELILKKDPLIFFDLEDDENGENGMDSIAELINNIKEINDYKPIIVILNNPSKTEALQKVYGYTNIVCIPSKLSTEIFSLFIKSFADKTNFEKNDKNYYFKYSDTLRAVDVFHNIHVTSLSEREITFVSDIDIPMFSVLHLTLPVNCFVTIVPSYFELETSQLGKHYIGFIHGFSEDEIKNLRRFINQIIYKPISEFSPEVVKAVLEQKSIEKNIEASDDNEEENETDEATADYKNFKRPPISGKSKL